MEAWLTPTRAALILIGYLGFVFGASVPLQQKTSLSNWAPDCYLLVGGDGSGQHLWNGKIFSLQLWDHPLAGIRARSLTADRLPAENDPYLLVSYDFANVPPFKDEKRFLPALIRVRHTPALGNSASFDPIVNFWLASKEPIPNLIRTLQKTNQFALRVVCEPAQVAGANGHIISIGDEAHILNLRLRQEGDALFIWLRTPLSVGPGNLVWMVPHVFVVNHVQKILLAYDGSYGSLYVNGHMASRPYRLNPGAGLAQMFGGIATESLDGYSIVYDGIVFAPIGLLLGMAARKRNEQGISDWLLLAAGLIAPAILFEWFLDHLSGRTGSVAQAGLCACMSLLGWMWINADRPARRNPGG